MNRDTNPSCKSISYRRFLYLYYIIGFLIQPQNSVHVILRSLGTSMLILNTFNTDAVIKAECCSCFQVTDTEKHNGLTSSVQFRTHVFESCSHIACTALVSGTRSVNLFFLCLKAKSAETGSRVYKNVT